MAGATQEKCGRRVQGPVVQESRHQCLHVRTPPATRPTLQPGLRKSQVSALDKGPEKRRKGPHPKHQLAVSLCVQGKQVTSSPWQHSLAGPGGTPLLPKEQSQRQKASGTSPNTQGPGGGARFHAKLVYFQAQVRNTPAGSRDSDFLTRK